LNARLSGAAGVFDLDPRIARLKHLGHLGEALFLRREAHLERALLLGPVDPGLGHGELGIEPGKHVGLELEVVEQLSRLGGHRLGRRRRGQRHG
jgi:hypothetical protein